MRYVFLKTSNETFSSVVEVITLRPPLNSSLILIDSKTHRSQFVMWSSPATRGIQFHTIPRVIYLMERTSPSCMTDAQSIKFHTATFFPKVPWCMLPSLAKDHCQNEEFLPFIFCFLRFSEDWSFLRRKKDCVTGDGMKWKVRRKWEHWKITVLWKEHWRSLVLFHMAAETSRSKGNEAASSILKG